MSGDFGQSNYDNAVEALRGRYRKSQQQEIDELIADIMVAKDEIIRVLEAKLANREAMIVTLTGIIGDYDQMMVRMIDRAAQPVTGAPVTAMRDDIAHLKTDDAA